MKVTKEKPNNKVVVFIYNRFYSQYALAKFTTFNIYVNIIGKNVNFYRL